MKNYRITVNGTSYDVSVEELSGRGFSIPFWVGGLIPRLATSYSSPSNHLQM